MLKIYSKLAIKGPKCRVFSQINRFPVLLTALGGEEGVGTPCDANHDVFRREGHFPDTDFRGGGHVIDVKVPEIQVV